MLQAVQAAQTGFDYSGIVQYAYSQIGIKLSRTAQNQYDQSIKVSANEAKAGPIFPT